MPYANKEDVKALFRDLETDATNSALTDIELDLFLDNTTEIIDAKIGTLYTLPIDGIKSIKILKQAQMFLVAGIVDDILNSYPDGQIKPEWAKKGYKILDALVPEIDKNGKQAKPSMILPDASYNGTDLQRATISVAATSGRVFVKGQDNW